VRLAMSVSTRTLAGNGDLWEVSVENFWPLRKVTIRRDIGSFVTYGLSLNGAVLPIRHLVNATPLAMAIIGAPGTRATPYSSFQRSQKAAYFTKHIRFV
jgi:hypothetical protein